MTQHERWHELAQQLRVDSVRAAAVTKSGHPTSSMSAADLMAVLLAKHLRYDFGAPENPANDPTHGENWGPERSVRAAILRWLYTDSDVNRFLDPSGLGVAGARIEGKLDLSYVKADKPLTTVRCYIPDGIDVTFSHLQSFEVRGSSTGPIAADMSELAGDLAVRFGTYGSLSLFRARIGGNLDCTGSTLLSGGQRSVNAVGSTVAGDMIFHDGFTTDGIVALKAKATRK